MKKGLTVWLALMLACLCGAALAQVEPLPMDQSGGFPPREDGYLSETEYRDESLHVQVSTDKLHGVKIHIVRVKIAHPSQIRTAMSTERVDDHTYVKAVDMADRVNAVAAVNGDFFKYHHNIGYIVRQGQFIRNALNGLRDVLVIDDQGDFWGVKTPDKAAMEDFLQNVFPQGRQVVNTFYLGPVLVENGVVQEITTREFQQRYKMQRVAIVQLGKLDYAIVECDGKTDASYGMTMATFAGYIQSIFPDCRLAYNLDGGGSTNVIFKGERIHWTDGARKISDILYFASAQGVE